MTDSGVDIDPERVGNDAGWHGLHELVDTSVLALASMDLVRCKMESDDRFADMKMGRSTREEPIRTSIDEGALYLKLADVAAEKLSYRCRQSERCAPEGDAHSCLVLGEG